MNFPCSGKNFAVLIFDFTTGGPFGSETYMAGFYGNYAAFTALQSREFWMGKFKITALRK